MADAQASGACGRKIVWVQVPSPAFFFVYGKLRFGGASHFSLLYISKRSPTLQARRALNGDSFKMLNIRFYITAR